MGITKDESIAYAQVLEVIKGLNPNEYKVIPKKKIQLYEKYKANDYKFIIDKSQKINNQISDKAKIIIANLFYRYIANEKDKKAYYQKEKEKFINNEIKKIKNTTPIFAEEKKPSRTEETALVEVKKQSIFQKILTRIKNLWRNK